MKIGVFATFMSPLATPKMIADFGQRNRKLDSGHNILRITRRWSRVRRIARHASGIAVVDRHLKINDVLHVAMAGGVGRARHGRQHKFELARNGASARVVGRSARSEGIDLVNQLALAEARQSGP